LKKAFLNKKSGETKEWFLYLYMKNPLDDFVWMTEKE
jgi:hypothetical protein